MQTGGFCIFLPLLPYPAELAGEDQRVFHGGASVHCVEIRHGSDEENPFVPKDVTDEAKGYAKWVNDHIWDLNRMQKEPEKVRIEPGEQYFTEQMELIEKGNRIQIPRAQLISESEAILEALAELLNELEDLQKEDRRS